MNLEKYDWGYPSTLINGTNDLRTPLILSDHIKDLIQDKVFCDLGCSEGDFALCCKRFAKQVIGVDFDTDRCIISRMKGLDVIEGDLRAIPLPDADIYYIWIGRMGITVLDRIPQGKTVIWVPQIDQRDVADKMTDNKHTFDYIRSGIPMKLVYYIIQK